MGLYRSMAFPLASCAHDKSTDPYPQNATVRPYASVSTAMQDSGFEYVKDSRFEALANGSPSTHCLPGRQCPGSSGASIPAKRTRRSPHLSVSPSVTVALAHSKWVPSELRASIALSRLAMFAAPEGACSGLGASNPRISADGGGDSLADPPD